MIDKLFFIYNGDNGRSYRVANNSMRLLFILSFLSREIGRHPLASFRTRERTTVLIGILNTVIPVILILEKTYFRISAKSWLVVAELSIDGNAETPSAAVPPHSPVPPTLCASGKYRDSGSRHYKLSLRSLYLSKRGRYFAPPLLPCRVKQPLA